MITIVLIGILIPFAGTSIGAAMVFFMRQNMPDSLHGKLCGFSGGVMLAASFFSLLSVAIERGEIYGSYSAIPITLSFLGGMFLMVFLDKIMDSICSDGMLRVQELKKEQLMLFLAVTIHNIPEGLAVGVGFAAMLYHDSAQLLNGAMTLAIGIAIQNIPEGAIISMPLKEGGLSKRKAFLTGCFTGAVEPVAAVLTLLAAGVIEWILPCMLGFAAGSMVYVVISELVPTFIGKNVEKKGLTLFSVGFAVMMLLDNLL